MKRSASSLLNTLDVAEVLRTQLAPMELPPGLAEESRRMDLLQCTPPKYTSTPNLAKS